VLIILATLLIIFNSWVNAVKVGAVDYLLKPINIKELKQTIKKLLMIKNKKIKVETTNELLVMPNLKNN